MDDNKDKKIEAQTPVSRDDFKYIDNSSLFKHVGVSDENFLFQYKKTEKILAALYLVTNFLSPEEPLRWELRELGLKLLSSVMSYKDALPSEQEALSNAIKTTVLEMISLLQIAYFAGFISSMNFEVLKKEFVLLLDSVSNTKQSTETFLLPNNFFNDPLPTRQIPPLYSQGVEQLSYMNPPTLSVIKDKTNQPAPTQILKGQNILKTRYPKAQKDNAPKAAYGAVLVKKTSRQSVILNLLKKQSEIMVKDVALLIDNCSEKTLQRELLSMVEQGVLKKRGERRWSRYSFA